MFLLLSSLTKLRLLNMSLAAQNDYLNEQVYPTLMPLLEKLIKTVKRDGHSNEAEGEFDPLKWLAQELMRNNPHKGDGKQTHDVAI